MSDTPSSTDSALAPTGPGRPVRPYGYVQDDIPPGTVLVAIRIWEAIAPEFDPLDLWTGDEIDPLLRTLTQTLTDNLDVLLAAANSLSGKHRQAVVTESES